MGARWCSRVRVQGSEVRFRELGIRDWGLEDDAPAITVTMRDERCAMVNIDPDSASLAPEVMKAVVRANQNYAGVYAAVTRVGRVAVGQRIFLRA